MLRNYDSAASPEVVANAVSRALGSPNPRRRYAVPFQARLFVFLRWLLREWAWETLIRLTFRTWRD